MYSALAVANAFLELARKEKATITPLKMQKLLYFAQGWSLKLRDRALFEDAVVAWRHGPVIPIVYQAFRSRGSGSITEPITHTPYWQEPVRNDIDGESLELIKQVWDAYKHLSAIEISTLSHENGHPWEAIKQEYGDDLEEKNPIISQDELKEAFHKLFD